MAKVVIDASGDGDVAARAGAPFWQTVKDEAPRLNDALMYRIEFGSRRPAGTFACDFGTNAVVWGPGVGPDQRHRRRRALPRRGAGAAAGLRGLRREAGRDTRSWPMRRVVETPPLLGIRQTRFIEGEYKLTADDAITGPALRRRGRDQLLPHHPLLRLPALPRARGLRHPLPLPGAAGGRRTCWSPAGASPASSSPTSRTARWCRSWPSARPREWPPRLRRLRLAPRRLAVRPLQGRLLAQGAELRR